MKAEKSITEIFVANISAMDSPVFQTHDIYKPQAYYQFIYLLYAYYIGEIAQIKQRLNQIFVVFKYSWHSVCTID